MRRFEYDDGSSRKFWEVDQDGDSVNVRYGKIGATGQSQSKKHADAANAQAAMLKLIKEKTGKGYVETGAAPVAPATSAPAAAPRAPVQAAPAPRPAPAAAAATQPHVAGVAPWLAHGDPVAIPADLAVAALPTRAAPRPIETRTAAECWAQFTLGEQWFGEVAGDTSAPHLVPAIEEANRRLAGDDAAADGSHASDVILMAVAAARSTRVSDTQATAFTDFLVASKGLAYALDVLLDAERLGASGHWHDPSRRYRISLHDDADGALAAFDRGYSPAEVRFRDHLALAPQASWDACAARIVAAAPGLSPWRRPLLGVLLPDLPAFSEQMAEELGHAGSPPPVLALYASVRSEAALSALASLAPDPDDLLDFLRTPWVAPTLLRSFGARALDILAPAIGYDDVAAFFAHVGTPAAITVLARVSSVNKTSQLRLNDAVGRWPLAAIAALAELAAGTGKDAGRHASALAALVPEHLAALPSFTPWISPSAQAAIERIAGKLAAPPEVADNADLPRVLANPPWLAPRRKTVAPLDLAPLPLPVLDTWDAQARDAVVNGDWIQRRLRESTDAGTLVRNLGIEAYSSKGVDTAVFAARAKQAIALGDAAAFSACWLDYINSGARRYYYLNAPYLSKLPAPMGLDVWNALGGEDGYGAEFALAFFGMAGLPGVVAGLRQRPNDVIGCAAHVAAVEMAAPIARAYLKMKTSRAAAQAWLLAHPEYAACGLVAAALGKAGEARDCAGAALRMLARHGHEALLMEVAARYVRADVDTSMRAMLDEDPLDLHPKKISAAPDFWKPATWTRPVLASNGKALPDTALDHIGAMLRFPSSEGVYPGIAQARDACERQSLADFMWDAFNAWIAAGSPSKEGWVMAGLGLLGNDSTARELTRFIRTWPGEGQHTRAVSGLDVLATIGSDTALMLLNGIAQKIKFKALQDRAREKIQQVAEAREMSPEELEDRLAPDLGLDAQGGIDLDFGPRRFRAGFDEALKPYVLDQDGARLPDLPKPRQSDDAALAAAATERFKTLKKDARTIASQQVLRLELAMCAQRRWTAAVFDTFLARHPLLGHLARRIVWGAYRVAPGATHGGELLACFRISSEGALTDAADDPFTLPDGAAVGIPHALDMAADTASAFAQLLADYKVVQPFRQLGRETHAIGAEELAAHALKRWDGVTVESARLRGLAGKGWRRGDAQDSGIITHLSKELGRGRLIELHFAPGILVGMSDENPKQILGELRTGPAGKWGRIEKAEPFSVLDPVHASEMVRDIDALRA